MQPLGSPLRWLACADCGCSTAVVLPSVFARHKPIPALPPVGRCWLSPGAPGSQAVRRYSRLAASRGKGRSLDEPLRWLFRDLCSPLRWLAPSGRSPRATSSASHRRGQALVATQLWRHRHQVAVVRPRRRAGLLAECRPSLHPMHTWCPRGARRRLAPSPCDGVTRRRAARGSRRCPIIAPAARRHRHPPARRARGCAR